MQKLRKNKKNFMQLLLSEYSNNYLTNGKFCGIITLEKERNNKLKYDFKW